MSTRAKTFKATWILLFGYGISQLLRFGGSLITTRMLAPDLFGVMAIANSMVEVISLFSDLGLGLNVIVSKHGENPRFIKTIYSLRFIQGLLLSAIIVVFALGIAVLEANNVFPRDSTLSHDDLPKALFVVALSAALSGMRSIQFELSARKQNVAAQTLINICAQAFSIIFTVIAAAHAPSIYNLAFASVVANLTITAGSFIRSEKKYRGFAWDKNFLSDIFSFGKWIAVSTALVGLSRNVDKIFFGYVLTSTQMGVYSVAALIFVAMENVFKKVSEALYPAMGAVVRDRPSEVARIYYEIRLYRDLFISALASLVIVNGDILIGFLYDKRYVHAGYFLQLMSIAHLVECFLLKNQIITARGNSRIQYELSLKRFLAICVLLPVGNYFMGITGMLLALSLRRIFGSVLLFKEFSKLGYLRPRKEAMTLLVIAGCLLAALVVRMIVIWAFGLSSYPVFPAVNL